MCNYSYSSTGPRTCTDSGSPETITFSGTDMVYFWVEGLGSVEVPVVSFSDSTTIYITSSTKVDSNDSLFASGPVTLYGIYNMIKPDLTNATYSSPFLTDASEEDPYVMQIDPTAWTATYTNEGTSGTINTDNLTSAAATGIHSWGVQSGNLYTSIAALQDPASTNTYYEIETGPNSWNQHREIRQNSSVVSFDKPLNCSYTHSISASSQQLYQLNYGGAGDLWGIPWEQVSSTLWRPKVTIPDGTELSCKDANDNSVTYLARALDVEQQMSEVSASNCSDLSTDFDLSLPGDDFVDPDIGDMPTDLTIKVITGVVQ